MALSEPIAAAVAAVRARHRRRRRRGRRAALARRRSRKPRTCRPGTCAGRSSQLSGSPRTPTPTRDAPSGCAPARRGRRRLDAIDSAGYGSPSRVYERTDDLLGMTPAQAKRGAPGETIRYTLADTLARPAGRREHRARRVPRRVRRVRRRARRRGRPPIPARDDRAGRGRVTRLGRGGGRARRRTAGPPTSAPPELPLDVRGTVFQRQVWAALREIPPGETVTYSQLAAAIGRPTATRAVAAACGANPTAVVVPCHRVIGADGSLTGYRWGVERKRALLDREAPVPRVAVPPGTVV